MLAEYGHREPQSVPERIDSLELAWLVHQAEQRYGAGLDLDDDDLAAMSTVSGAVDVLRRALSGPAGQGGAQPGAAEPEMAAQQGAEQGRARQ